MPSGRLDALVIHNPAAGARHPERFRNRIAAEVGRRRERVEVCTTTGAGAARELARRAVEEGISRVIVAGGDGTISEVATAIAGGATILGVIPGGTGNQLAFELGLPLALDRAVAVAMGDSLRRIDVGWVDGRAFTAMAGAGIDAAVIGGADPRTKRWAGKMAYIASALRAVSDLPRSRLVIRVDERTWKGDGIGVLVANVPRLRVPFLAHGLTVVPGGSVEDGLLDCCALAVDGVPGLAREVWLGLRGADGGGSDLQYLRGRTIVVEADPPLGVQVDGDLAGTTPFRAEVRPGALVVAAPRPGSGRRKRSGSRAAAAR